MTWNDMLRIELQRLHALEGAIVPIVENMGSKAQRADVKAILHEAVESTPSRLGRLETICAMGDWPCVGEYPETVEGWRRDVYQLALREPPSDVNDAMILALLLKITRMRTSCYEAAYILASHLGVDHVPNLISGLWAEVRANDDQTASALASLVGHGEGDLDVGFFRA